MTPDSARETAATHAAEVAPGILRTLLQFDTTFEAYSDPPREDAALQAYIARFLGDLGADVEMFEPDATELAGYSRCPADISFVGRPIVMAKLSGAGGRSLLLNGHFDTVPAGPIDEWRCSPWSGSIAGDQMIGRGASDMKGGLAAGLAALSGIIDAGIPLGGDVYFNSVPYEEAGGHGTVATVRRGYRADAAVTLEPSGLSRVSIGTRGLVIAEVTVQGRSAHAEIPQPHFENGGGVNAIEKLIDILGPLRRMTEEWRTRPDKQHSELGPGHVMVTLIEGGDWLYTYPATARATLNVPYLPADADDDGFGGRVCDEVETRIRTLAQLDPWLRNHPPRIRWTHDFPPAEISRTDPLVSAVVSAARKHDREVTVGMNNAWGDFATLISEAGIPSIVYGPKGGGEHAVNEYMSVTELTTGAAVITDLVLDWTAG